MLASSLLACEPATDPHSAGSTHQYSNVPLLDAELSADASKALTLNIDGVLSLWDNQNHSLVKQWQDFGLNEHAYYAALSADKQWVAVAGKTQVSILDVNKDQILLSWKAKGFNVDATLTVLALGQSNKDLWIGLSDGSIISVDLQTNKKSIFVHHHGPVADIKISDDQQRILSSSTDGSVVYWNAVNGTVLNEREQNYRITSLAFDQTKQNVFLSDALKTQLIWDLDQQKVISQLSYFTGARTFRQALFVDNGRKLVSASSKNTMTLWDVNSGEELKQWHSVAVSTASSVVAMASGHNGQLHTLSSDGVLEIWPIDLYSTK